MGFTVECYDPDFFLLLRACPPKQPKWLAFEIFCGELDHPQIFHGKHPKLGSQNQEK